jgi:acyl carrier protein
MAYSQGVILPAAEIWDDAMQIDAIYSQLTTILREVFDDPALVARPDLAADDVEDWDSLSHLRLITTVQKAFGVKFSAGEIGRLNNVGDLAALIQAKAP